MNDANKIFNGVNYFGNFKNKNSSFDERNINIGLQKTINLNDRSFEQFLNEIIAK